MSRDYRKLEVFVKADALALEVYAITRALPAIERFGLQAQIRKAAVSVPTNLVEGSTRRSELDYARFVEVSYGSAREVGYLLGFAVRLGFLDSARTQPLIVRYDRLQARLNRLLSSLEQSTAEERDRKAFARRTRKISRN